MEESNYGRKTISFCRDARECPRSFVEVYSRGLSSIAGIYFRIPIFGPPLFFNQPRRHQLLYRYELMPRDENSKLLLWCTFVLSLPAMMLNSMDMKPFLSGGVSRRTAVERGALGNPRSRGKLRRARVHASCVGAQCSFTHDCRVRGYGEEAARRQNREMGPFVVAKCCVCPTFLGVSKAGRI